MTYLNDYKAYLVVYLLHHITRYANDQTDPFSDKNNHKQMNIIIIRRNILVLKNADV